MCISWGIIHPSFFYNGDQGLQKNLGCTYLISHVEGHYNSMVELGVVVLLDEGCFVFERGLLGVRELQGAVGRDVLGV